MPSAIDWKVNDISNPLGKAFYELATAIEKLPASTDQTACQTKRQEAERVVNQLLDAMAVMREGLEVMRRAAWMPVAYQERAAAALTRADQLLAGDAKQGGGGV